MLCKVSIDATIASTCIDQRLDKSCPRSGGVRGSDGRLHLHRIWVKESRIKTDFDSERRPEGNQRLRARDVLSTPAGDRYGDAGRVTTLNYGH